MNSNKIPIREIKTIIIGEVLVGIIICVAFLIFGKFDYKVLLGAILGVVVTVANFVFLCISVNKALDKCLAGFAPDLNDKIDSALDKVLEEESSDKAENDQSENEDPYDDEAAKFARENQAKLQNSIKLSYTVRTLTVVIALVVALFTKQFNVIATVIPLLCLRPILTVAEIFRRKEEQ